MKTKYTYYASGKTRKCYRVNLSAEDSIITRYGGSICIPTEDGGRANVSLDNVTANVEDLNVYTCIYIGCHISLKGKRRVIVIDNRCEEKLSKNERIDVINVDDYPTIKYETICFNDILFDSEFFGPEVEDGDIFLVPCYMDYDLDEVWECRDEVMQIIKDSKRKSSWLNRMFAKLSRK
jgi:hypothetical protein